MKKTVIWALPNMEKCNKPHRPSANSTRHNIIDSARKLFLKQGFSATSIKEIAELAGVNTNLIFHHYESKNNLWNEVKANIVGHAQIFEEQKYHTAEQFISSIIKTRFDFYNHNKDVAQLLKWQHLTGEEKLNSMNAASPVKWKLVIKKFQKQGKIRSDLDVNLIILFIASSVTAPFMQSGIKLNPEKKLKYRKMVTQACLQYLLI